MMKSSSICTLLITLTIFCAAGAQPPLFNALGGIWLEYGCTGACSKIHVNDFNGDGIDDVIIASTHSAIIYFFNTDGLYTENVFDETGNIPDDISSADLNGDESPDLIIVDHDVSVFMNNGDGTFQTPITFGEYLTGIEVGDIDDDNDIDLLLTTEVSVIAIYLNNGGGVYDDSFFLSLGEPFIENIASEVIAADFDSDNDSDLVAAFAYTGTFAYYENTGGGNFTYIDSFQVGDAIIDIDHADFDGDGDADISALNAASTVSILYNNGMGDFSGQMDYPTGDYPAALWAADYDRDGMPDVAVANAGSSSMTVLINDGGGGFYEYPESGSSAGYISNLNGIDLQDDGDIDFLGGSDHNEVVTIFNDSYPFICGDPNDDGQSNVGDVVFIISYVFKGGPAPEYTESGDVNFDGQANVGDAVYLINTIFKNGPPPGCGYNGVYDYYGERDIDTIGVSESIQNGDSVMVTYSFDPDCYFFYPVQYTQSGDSLIFRAYMHYYYYRSFCSQPGGTISVPVSLTVSQPGDYYIVYRNPAQEIIAVPVTIW